MAAETATSAVLSYIGNGEYPTDETVASSSFAANTLAELSAQLRKAQDEIKEEIRGVSRTAAPDIDTWISRARSLQVDIQQSREAARQIVADAEAARDLRTKVKDAGDKVTLLEKEVTFNETLIGTLHSVRETNDALGNVLEALANADIEMAMMGLERVEPSIGAMKELGAPGVYDVLKNKAMFAGENIMHTTRDCWEAAVHVNPEHHRISISATGIRPTQMSAEMPAMQLTDLIKIAQALDFYNSLLQNLSKSLDTVILRPRLSLDARKLGKITVQGTELYAERRMSNDNHAALFEDVKLILNFLSTNLPESVCLPLSELLIPILATRLEEYWLNNEALASLKDLQEFDTLVEGTLDVASMIDRLGWQSGDQIRLWAQDAPKLWLKQQRESLLNTARTCVFTYSRDMKVVEKVETQLLDYDDALVSGEENTNGAPADEGEWDTAWDEPEEVPNTSSKTATSQENAVDDDDEASAWDLDDDEVQEDKTGSHGEEDAWGWGDGDDDGASKRPPAPSTADTTERPEDNPPTKQQEITLREKYTTTFVPTRLLELIASAIEDNTRQFGLSALSKTSGPLYDSGVFGPGPSAFLTLPNLMFAIFRATASIAYTKLSVGNMLMYNDATHLVYELREWKLHKPDAKFMRLDNEIKSLESFAKRAYSTEMEAQRTILRDLVDGAQGFSNATVMPYKQEGESAIDQVVDRLRDVHRMWNGVLRNGALLQSMGALVSTVTSKMMSDIQDLPDIGEADSKQLKLLCDKVLAIRDIFSQDREDGKAQVDMTFVYTPNWLKFQYLTEILESSLADIKYLWNEGELALEFSKEEVVELIEALFAESDLRRRAISDIRRSERGT